MQRFFIALLIFLVPFAYAELSVTELMFNPDDGNEWVEVYTDISLENLTLTDNFATDEIVCCETCPVIEGHEYVLILDQDSTLVTNATAFCVDDNSIGNGLTNSGDQIILALGNDTLANVSYNMSTRPGNSLCLINGTWFETLPTPGAANVISHEEEPSSGTFDLGILQNIMTFYSGIGYENFFRVTNLDYPDYNHEINCTFYYNVSFNDSIIAQGGSNISLKHYTTQDTGSADFSLPGNYTLCGAIEINDSDASNNALCFTAPAADASSIDCNISLKIDSDLLHTCGDSLGYYLVVSNDSLPYLVTYWIEDLHGSIIKNPQNTTNTNKKSYTPKLSIKDSVMLIRAQLRTACNNSNQNTSAEKMVVAKGIRPEHSILKIEEIVEPSGGAAYGKTIKVKGYIYKADTTKESVKIYVENGKRISSTLYFYAEDKFTEYRFTLPVELEDSCTAGGDYYVIMEGLDLTDKERLKVNAGTCKKSSSQSEPSSESLAPPPVKEYELLTMAQEMDRVTGFVRLKNPTNIAHNYSIWSYVYRGSKSYTGDRTDNLAVYEIGPYEERTLVLWNDLSEVPGGEYSVKIRAQRDDRKTPHEFTQNITVNSTTLFAPTQNASPLPDRYNVSKNMITGQTVYESAQKKMSNNSLYFLGVAIALVAIALIKLQYNL